MDELWMKNATFLIVDDQDYNISLLQRILNRAGYSNLVTTTDPTQLETLYRAHQPDIVLLDLHMPGMDGFEALRYLREWKPEGDYLPVLVLTADVTPEARKRVLHEGANDFITKPFDRTEVVLRIQNFLATRFYHLQLQEKNHDLERRVRERTKALELAQAEILDVLGRTAEYRDDETGQHTERVADLAVKIALALGLPAEEAALIGRAAPLHDIGKIGIPDGILLKPGRFTPEEFAKMKLHTDIGASILEGSRFPVLQVARIIALTHHEKWNGAGYPSGLSGETIPLAGRIVAIADFYDALTHERPYKRAWTQEEAIAEIRIQSGQHFDPKVIEAFFSVIENGLTNDNTTKEGIGG
ncbi:response regulator [Paenibacillus sp. LHD-117]|uniref:HD domain-containing phosphohydrolase n=1 Tax=Paenibacillus sp. LHD-117 TaxID=3071412 RepID=UPI0027DF537C|nr:HD domain-containing phosphohydrolase [Paenibacillus sp. LHD-117]MDQ6423113.1 response regulator [Paenibacillus sp. LHD-117]